MEDSEPRRRRVGGTFAHHRGPLPDDPFRDQAAFDVRIVLGELLHHVLRRDGKEQDPAVDRIGEGSAELELAPRHGRAGVLEVGDAKLGSTLERIGAVGIEEEEVHGGGPRNRGTG